MASILPSWIHVDDYFFETRIWIGCAIHALPCANSDLARLGPAIILAGILRVTEGDLDRGSQARVSAFVPWSPEP